MRYSVVDFDDNYLEIDFKVKKQHIKYPKRKIYVHVCC